MEFVKLRLNRECDGYLYRDSSSVKMDLLGIFFLTDIRCSNDSALFHKEWAYNDSQGLALSGNCIFLEKDGNYVYFSDLFPEDEDDLIKLKISRKQFAEILSIWLEKVCEKKPIEVIIKYENNVFTIETKGDTIEQEEVNAPQEELKIDFIMLQLEKDGFYSFKKNSNIEMNIIGNLFADIGHSEKSLYYYEDWPFSDSLGESAETKTVALRKEGDFILLVDKNDQSKMKILRHKLSQLSWDWQKKVYKAKAKEVTINRINDVFSIEASS